MANGDRRYLDDVPDDVEARVGTRWMVRKKTFAHVLGIEFDGEPSRVVLAFRSPGEELEMLRRAGHPFHHLGWGRDA